jgi:hypothetical protein
MRFFVFAALIIVASGNLPGARAQDASPRIEFAVVTPVSGSIGELVVNETLSNGTTSGVEHAVLGPSPLTKSASILVPVGPTTANTTAIAIANPSTSSGHVNLILTDATGLVVLNTNVSLGSRGQIAKFVNDLFPAQPAEFASPLLLTISSEIPVGIVALNFRGGDFTSIPLNGLSTPAPVIVQTSPPPSTPATLTSSSPGFGIGLPPPPTPPFTVGPPLTVSTSPVPTTSSVGGSLVFPLVVVGGNWSAEIAIGNTSAGTQIARIEFFGSDGTLISNLSNIAIPPKGVFFFTSE